MTTLAHIHDRGAHLYPNDKALVWDSGKLDYRAYRQRVGAIAAGLLKMGVAHGDRAAILARNGPVQILSFGACELTGITAVALNFRLTWREIIDILKDSGAETLIFEADFANTVAEIRNHGLDGLRFVCAEHPLDWAMDLTTVEATGMGVDVESHPQPDDTAYLIYTSGTTGHPKGVMLSHASQVALAEEVVTAGGVRQNDSVLVVMPLFHIGAKSKQLAYSLAGGTVHVHQAFDPKAALDALAREAITATHLAPIMVQMLTDEYLRDPCPLPALKNIYYASAPMPVEMLRRAINAFGNIFTQFYGMTETGVSTVLQAHHHVLDGPDGETARLASAGQPTFRSQVRVVDEAGKDLPPHSPGEVLLGGPTIMQGYWNMPDATADTLVDGWVRSGDIGIQDGEGFLFIVDRKKDVIISGGENIYPREVEEVLVTHPGIEQAAVIGVPDRKWGERVCAYVVARDGQSIGEDDLIDYVRTRIASYKKPKEVRFVDLLPRLPNGKIDKKSLRAETA